MPSRFGLRWRMAASYVLVSAAAVLVVEAVVLTATVPRIVAADREADRARRTAADAEADSLRSKASAAAVEIASVAGSAATAAAVNEPGRTDEELLKVALTSRSSGGLLGSSGPELLQAVASADGRVVQGSPPDAFAPGVMLPAEVLHGGAGLAGAGPAWLGSTWRRPAAATWASAPIQVAEPGGGRRTIGLAYVVLAEPSTAKPGDANPDKPVATTIGATLVRLITPAVVVLVLLVPVGGLFGLLSTGRLIRRLRRLADSTAAMAAGDLGVRIPVTGRASGNEAGRVRGDETGCASGNEAGRVPGDEAGRACGNEAGQASGGGAGRLSGGDEVGRLEVAFNIMAARLAAAQQAERAAAGAQARQAERARIARELHDAISQDLFSASLMAGGLRKALPPASELQRRAAAMEAALGRTMREMRAMLLELRPIALEDAGLAEAIGALCGAYEARLGVRITTTIGDLPGDPALEHAVLRVTQEAVSNAIRHGNPSRVDLRIEPDGDAVVLTVHDDGRGFDPDTAADRHGMGLRLMRERAEELGGSVEVHSALGEGTTLRVRLPIGV